MQELEFEELVKKYENLIRHFIKKYKGICEKYQIDTDEIEQICLISLWNAQKDFNSSKGTSFTTFTYNQMTYAIKNRLKEVKEADRNTISLQLLSSNDDDTTTLQDTLEDPVNVAAEIEDKLMEIFYRNRIRHALNEEEATAILDKVFYGCIGVDYKLIKKARKNLIRRDAIFREEYFKIKNLKENTLIYE